MAKYFLLSLFRYDVFGNGKKENCMHTWQAIWDSSSALLYLVLLREFSVTGLYCI